MSNNPEHSWDEANVLDDVNYNEEDAKTFKQLINVPSAHSEESDQSLKSGSVLKGKIVEISKDFVVVDVGLKSEGLVPMEEFSDLSQIILDNEVEVLLDEPEDENGQIVLSREKAEKLRKWEYISRTL